MSGRMRLAAIAGLLAIVGLVTADVVLGGPLDRFDWVVHGWVNRHSNGALPICWHVLAVFGQRGVVLAPVVICAVLTSARQRSLRPVLAAAATILAVTVLVGALKVGIGRTAPGTGVNRVFTGGLEYPSGHSVNAIVLWGLTFEYAVALSARARAWLPPRRRHWLAGLLGAVAGLGMTGLDYHWLTDVLAGWPLGLAIYLAMLAADPVGLRARPRSGRSAPWA